eukprot:COSAG01_NODE_36450_length_517_cov_3.351675_1_plen_86_part_01
MSHEPIKRHTHVMRVHVTKALPTPAADANPACSSTPLQGLGPGQRRQGVRERRDGCCVGPEVTPLYRPAPPHAPHVCRREEHARAA